MVCPWDDEFDEFIDGVKWKDFPQASKVELRPKAAMGIEAIAAIAQANTAQPRPRQRLPGKDSGRGRAGGTEKAHEEAARMGEAMAAVEAKMRKMEEQAKQRALSWLERRRRQRSVQPRKKRAEERAAQQSEAQERIQETERRQKKKLDKTAAELQRVAAHIKKAKAEAAEMKAKEQGEDEEEEEEEEGETTELTLGGFADAQSEVQDEA